MAIRTVDWTRLRASTCKSVMLLLADAARQHRSSVCAARLFTTEFAKNQTDSAKALPPSQQPCKQQRKSHANESKTEKWSRGAHPLHSQVVAWTHFTPFPPTTHSCCQSLHKPRKLWPARLSAAPFLLWRHSYQQSPILRMAPKNLPWLWLISNSREKLSSDHLIQLPILQYFQLDGQSFSSHPLLCKDGTRCPENTSRTQFLHPQPFANDAEISPIHCTNISYPKKPSHKVLLRITVLWHWVLKRQKYVLLFRCLTDKYQVKI